MCCINEWRTVRADKLLRTVDIKTITCIHMKILKIKKNKEICSNENDSNEKRIHSINYKFFLNE